MSNSSSNCNSSGVHLPKSIDPTTTDVAQYTSNPSIKGEGFRSVDSGTVGSVDKEFDEFTVSGGETLAPATEVSGEGWDQVGVVAGGVPGVKGIGKVKENHGIVGQGATEIETVQDQALGSVSAGATTRGVETTCPAEGVPHTEADPEEWDWDVEEDGSITEETRTAAMATAMRIFRGDPNFDKVQYEKDLVLGSKKLLRLMEGKLHEELGETWESAFKRFQKDGSWSIRAYYFDNCITVDFNTVPSAMDPNSSDSERSQNQYVELKYHFLDDASDDRLGTISLIERAFPHYGSPQFDRCKHPQRLVYKSESGNGVVAKFVPYVVRRPEDYPTPELRYTLRFDKYDPKEWSHVGDLKL